MRARLLRIELRRNEYRWLFPLLAIGGILAVTDQIDDDLVFWADASVLLRNSVWLIGPFVAMAAAWMAAREHRFGLDDLLATTARPALRRKLTTWGATTLLGLIAYGLVGVWVAGFTAPRNEWTGPDWGVILIGALGVPFYSALGFALGTAKPRRASAFVAIVLFGLGTAILSSDNKDWTSFLTPVPLVERTPWSGITPDLEGPHAIYLLAMTAFGLGLVARSCRRSWLTRGWLTAAGTIALLAAVAMANRAPAAEARPAASTPLDAPEADAPLPGTYAPRCAGELVAVCVHPAFSPLLDRTSARVNRLIGALAGLPDRPTRVELLPYPDPAPSAGTVSLLLRADDVEGRLMLIMHNLAESLLLPPAGTVDDVDGGWQTRNVVLAWALQTAGQPISCADGQVRDAGGAQSSLFLAPCEALQRFAALDPAARQAWLRDRLLDVRMGRVPLEELP